MELMQWIRDEHSSIGDRFEHGVVDRVPLDQWHDPVGDGGSSLAWLTFHVAAHEDIAINGVVRAGEPLLTTWRSRLGLDAVPGYIGLGETEVPEVSALLDPLVLLAYARAVPTATAQWLDTVTPDALVAVPASIEGLARSGVDESAAPWLYRMWAEKPASWFVQWEAAGHRINHVGEMVSVRNRLGLSPF